MRNLENDFLYEHYDDLIAILAGTYPKVKVTGVRRGFWTFTTEDEEQLEQALTWIELTFVPNRLEQR